MHCPEYVWEMKDLTVNSKIDIFQEKYTDSQNAQNMTRIFKIAKILLKPISSSSIRPQY